MKLEDLTQEQLDVLILNLRNKDKLLRKKNGLIEKYRKLSLIDDLTGLYQRRFLKEALRRQRSFAKRNNMEVFFLFIDVDDFKKVNDIFLHVGANQLLIEIAQCIKETVRETDDVFRFGGDEFLIILSVHEADGFVELDNIVSRMKEKVSQIKLAPNQLIQQLSITVGKSSIGANCKDPMEGLREANRLMLEAKKRKKK